MADGSGPHGAAIYFAGDSYSAAGPTLMGRQAAGESFLQGYARHSGLDPFYCYAATQAEASAFAGIVAASSRGAQTRWVPMPGLTNLTEPGCLYFPGPDIGSLAWQRRAVGQRLFSLCGITHTISSARAMDSMLDLLVAPLQEWDAVILTSTAVRDAVASLLEPYAEYLTHRFGATRLRLPQLPVIPLGVDTDSFAPDGAARARWRERLGAGPDDVVVLYVGRLSIHAKAHPYPMLVALNRAAQMSGQRVHLVQAGWFAHPTAEAAFRAAASQHAPLVIAHFLDGRQSEVRREIWSAGDIFVSLADNIQETFGLSPVEGMAAGLPCIVSDWNGYKDTVRHGIDGFRVPTMMAPAGLGLDLSQRYAASLDDYDLYIGKTAQLAAVDIDATTEAFKLLVSDPELRQRMGTSGRVRAKAVFDWRTIIAQYQGLWADLADRRRVAQGEGLDAANAMPNLQRPDPLGLFANYPTFVLSPHCRVELISNVWAELLGNVTASLGRGIASDPAEIEHVVAVLAGKGPATVSAILASLPAERRALMGRTLAWLAKFGVVRITPVGT